MLPISIDSIVTIKDTDRFYEGEIEKRILEGIQSEIRDKVTIEYKDGIKPEETEVRGTVYVCTKDEYLKLKQYIRTLELELGKHG